jgi:hypothetical protein
MSISKEMQKALEADGEKLRQLTGKDHGPRFISECPSCDGAIEEWWSYCAMCGWRLASGEKP